MKRKATQVQNGLYEEVIGGNFGLCLRPVTPRALCSFYWIVSGGFKSWVVIRRWCVNTMPLGEVFQVRTEWVPQLSQGCLFREPLWKSDSSGCQRLQSVSRISSLPPRHVCVCASFCDLWASLSSCCTAAIIACASSIEVLGRGVDSPASTQRFSFKRAARDFLFFFIPAMYRCLCCLSIHMLPSSSWNQMALSFIVLSFKRTWDMWRSNVDVSLLKILRFGKIRCYLLWSDFLNQSSFCWLSFRLDRVKHFICCWSI